MPNVTNVAPPTGLEMEMEELRCTDGWMHRSISDFAFLFVFLCIVSDSVALINTTDCFVQFGRKRACLVLE